MPELNRLAVIKSLILMTTGFDNPINNELGKDPGHVTKTLEHIRKLEELGVDYQQMLEDMVTAAESAARGIARVIPL